MKIIPQSWSKEKVHPMSYSSDKKKKKKKSAVKNPLTFSHPSKEITPGLP